MGMVGSADEVRGGGGRCRGGGVGEEVLLPLHGGRQTLGRGRGGGEGEAQADVREAAGVFLPVGDFVGLVQRAGDGEGGAADDVDLVGVSGVLGDVANEVAELARGAVGDGA